MSEEQWVNLYCASLEGRVVPGYGSRNYGEFWVVPLAEAKVMVKQYEGYSFSAPEPLDVAEPEIEFADPPDMPPQPKKGKKS
jgi:hypothetical protein